MIAASGSSDSLVLSDGEGPTTPTSKRWRNMSDRNQHIFLTNIVEGQFGDNLHMLSEKLSSKRGLVQFLLGMIESGKLERAYQESLNPTTKVVVFAETSCKYVKHIPVGWFRAFFAKVAADALGPFESMPEEEQRKHRFSHTQCVSIFCLACNVDEECWIFDREQEKAMSMALTQYGACGQRLSHLRFPVNGDLATQGFYTLESGKIVASAMAMDPSTRERCFIEVAGCTPATWSIRPNNRAESTAVDQFGDTIAILRRFRVKYPDIFTIEACTPRMSLMPDNESAPPSLGKVSRKSGPGNPKKGQGKVEEQLKGIFECASDIPWGLVVDQPRPSLGCDACATERGRQFGRG